MNNKKLQSAYQISLIRALRWTPKNQAIVLRPKNEIVVVNQKVKVKDEKVPDNIR